MSACLAAKYGFSVLAIDCDEAQTCRAKTRADSDLFSGPRTSNVRGCLQHKTVRIDASHKSVRSLLDEDLPLDNDVGLCGLHACGDLSSLLCDMFARSPEARFLVLAGCCYNLLSPGSFPLSHLVRDQTSLRLSSHSKMLACQNSFQCWHDYSIASELCKRNFFRAILQVLIARRGGLPANGEDVRVGRIARHHDSFVGYARAALLRLNITCHDSELVEIYNEFSPQLPRLTAFCVLRLQLASVIESLVAFDRFLFLVECGMHAKVLPLFNPLLSPRNLVIVANRANRP